MQSHIVLRNYAFRSPPTNSICDLVKEIKLFLSKQRNTPPHTGNSKYLSIVFHVVSSFLIIMSHRISHFQIEICVPIIFFILIDTIFYTIPSYLFLRNEWSQKNFRIFTGKETRKLPDLSVQRNCFFCTKWMNKWLIVNEIFVSAKYSFNKYS